MGKTKNKTQTERAILFAAAIGGMTEEEANAMLAEANYEPATPSSWKMVVTRYVPIFMTHPKLLGECIKKPLSISDLIKRAKTNDDAGSVEV